LREKKEKETSPAVRRGGAQIAAEKKREQLLNVL